MALLFFRDVSGAADFPQFPSSSKTPTWRARGPDEAGAQFEQKQGEVAALCFIKEILIG